MSDITNIIKINNMIQLSHLNNLSKINEVSNMNKTTERKRLGLPQEDRNRNVGGIAVDSYATKRTYSEVH